MVAATACTRGRVTPTGMNPEFLFALISLTCLGLSDFFYRYGQRFGLKPGPFMLLQNVAYIVTAVSLGATHGDLVFHPSLAYGLANGVMAFLAFLFILLALKDGEATALVPIVRLNFAVTGLLTVALLGEQLSAARIIAALLAAIAIILMGSGVRAAARDRRPLAFAIGAMLLFGVIGLFYKFALRDGATPGAMVVAQSIGVFLMAVPFALYRREPIAWRGPRLLVPLLCGVLTATSYVALANAFTTGDAVVVAPIAQLSFVFTAVLAMLFLGERLGFRKLTGLFIAIVAVLVFAFV